MFQMNHAHPRWSSDPAVETRRRRQGGFTLVEVGITLGLAAVMLALALALWGGAIGGRRVVKVAEDLAGLLRFAQQAAVADSADACLYRVVITTTQGEARRVAREASGACTSPEVVSTVRVIEAYPRGVAVGAATVEFSSAGGLTTGTLVSIAVTSGGSARYVRVQPETGNVEVAPTP